MRDITYHTSNKFTWFLIAAGIFLLLAGIILGQSLEQKLTSLGGDLGTGKITASIRNELNPNPQSYFSEKDLNKLSLNVNDAKIACLSRITGPVANDYQTMMAVVNGVNYSYPQFHRLVLQSGGFFTSRAQTDREAVAVVDAALAVRLFNSEQVTGVGITIWGRKFKIIGVVAPEPSIIGALTDSGVPNLYIPVDLLLELAPGSRISYLQIQTADTGTTGKNNVDLETALQSIGKNPANYRIIDYNVQKILIGQKPHLILLFLCLITTFSMTLYLKSQFQSVFRKLWEDYQALYLSSILRLNRRLLILLLLKVSLILGGILLQWNLAAFGWYIPPKYIPDEFIDLQYFGNLIQNNIRETIHSIGYIPSPEELALKIVVSLSNLTFVVGIIGLFLIYGGLRRWRHGLRPWQESELIKSALYVGLLLLAALFVVTLFGVWLGLEVNPELKSLFVVWGFLFCGFIFGVRRQESSRTSSCEDMSQGISGKL